MIEVQRSHFPFGTYGLLTMPGFSCLTVERPWMQNRPWISCIPNGTYELHTATYHSGQADELRTLEIAPVPGRTSILIHPANWPDQLQGCLALGSGFFTADRGLGVSRSRETVAAFLRAYDRAGRPEQIRLYTSAPWGIADL